MISVTHAKSMISRVKPLTPRLVPLDLAVGYVLAEDVIGTYDVPSFDQSAMDGYAIRFEDKDLNLVVEGNIPAGKHSQKSIEHRQAMRIFTGAPVPKGADTVVMQEKVSIENGFLQVKDEQLQEGRNIRRKGSELRAGALALERGAVLTPAAIGFLAGIGASQVYIYPAPRTSVIVTGDELTRMAERTSHSPQFGEVFESNSFSLRAALQRAGITEVSVSYCGDNLPALHSVLQQALDNSDMVVLTGGVSVGDYDFVLRAASSCGISQLFHKVKQKPGKPLYFGMSERIPVFGLPGNPSSVLTCFYQYVMPAIEIFLQKKPAQPIFAPMSQSYTKTAGLTHFLKGHYNGRANLLAAQESYKMSSFALANCIICIPEDATAIAEGDEVELHLLPL